MEHALTVKVITPDGKLIEDVFDMVIVQAKQGEIGILPNHTAMISPVVIGAARLKKKDEIMKVAVGEGFIEVDRNHVTILVQSAETPKKIDIDRAKKAKERALRRLNQRSDEVDFRRAELALKRSINRLSLAEEEM